MRNGWIGVNKLVGKVSIKLLRHANSAICVISIVINAPAVNFITVTPLFAKLTCTIYLKHSIHLNMPQHWFSIGFNTFILITAASSRDVTTINMLMNSFVVTCKWSIPEQDSSDILPTMKALDSRNCYKLWGKEVKVHFSVFLIRNHWMW